MIKWIERHALWLNRTRDIVKDYSMELERLLSRNCMEEKEEQPLLELLANELVFNSVSNRDVLGRFRERYVGLCENRFPLLLPVGTERWDEYSNYIQSTGMSLEDYSQDIVFDYEPLLSQLTKLHQQLVTLRLAPEKCARIANLTLDLVQTCALVPSAMIFVPGKHDVHLHFDYQGGVTRYWIHSLPIDMVCETIKEIRLFATDLNNLKHSVLLSHLDWDLYNRQSLPQRISQLSLLNMSSYPLRDAVARDELVRRVVESPQLLQWMLCCSNMDEQYWLNTCESAARNNVLTARLCTIAHCFVVTRLTLERLAKLLPAIADDRPWVSSIWSCCFRMPSLREHAKQVIAEVAQDMQDLTHRAHALLDARDCDLHALHALVLDWNRTAQYLSSVFYPAEPAVLTRKLFSENWQLSAKAISLPCVVGSLLPRQPWVMSRSEGASGECDSNKGWFLWRTELSPTQYPHLEDLPTKMSTMSDAQSTAILEQLWSLALQCGGLYFGSKEHILGAEVGHLNVIYALRMPNSGKHFLVCDPEICHYKWLLFRDMKELIVNPHVNFDLFNV